MPSASRRPSTTPTTPLPVGESKSGDGREVELALLARRRRSQAPADARSPAPRSPPVAATSFSSNPLAANDGHDLRLAFGERAGLVDDEGVDLLHPLQRFGVLDQHADLGAASDADHDRHRRRQTERAGTGDDQDRDRGDQSEGETAAPARRCSTRRMPASATAITAGTNQPRHLVGQPLDRRPRAAAPPRPSARSATAWCRGRPFRPA